MRNPPSTAHIFGFNQMIKRPGMIPQSAEAFIVKSYQSKISSLISYFSFMKLNYLTIETKNLANVVKAYGTYSTR